MKRKYVLKTHDSSFVITTPHSRKSKGPYARDFRSMGTVVGLHSSVSAWKLYIYIYIQCIYV